MADNAPWVNLRLEELVRILNLHKSESENRKIKFREKLASLKERQDALQQRRVARLNAEGVIVDLDMIKKRVKNPKLMKWYVDDIEEGKAIAMKARMRAMMKHNEIEESECESPFEYESETEWDPDDLRVQSGRQRGASRGLQSRDGARLDLIHEQEELDTGKAKAPETPKKTVDKNVKKRFHHITNLITTSRYMALNVNKRRPGKLRSPERPLRRQNSLILSQSQKDESLIKEQVAALEEAIRITTPTPSPREARTRSGLSREHSFQRSMSMDSHRSTKSRTSLATESAAKINKK